MDIRFLFLFMIISIRFFWTSNSQWAYESGGLGSLLYLLVQEGSLLLLHWTAVSLVDGAFCGCHFGLSSDSLISSCFHRALFCSPFFFFRHGQPSFQGPPSTAEVLASWDCLLWPTPRDPLWLLCLQHSYLSGFLSDPLKPRSFYRSIFDDIYVPPLVGPSGLTFFHVVTQVWLRI